MNPRLVGALLVIAAIAVTISAPALLGRRTAGTAVMVELPRDPRVGDCVVNMPAEVSAGSAEGPTGTGRDAFEPPDSFGPLGPSFGPCNLGPVAGEVVALTDPVIDRATGQLQPPADTDCRAAALSYAGLVLRDGRFVVPDAPEDDPVSWSMSVNIRTSWVLPSPLLQSRQRSWAVCVVAPRSTGHYTGQFADAFNGGELPDQFSTCWNQRTVSAAFKRADCLAPHLAELISAGTILDRSRTTSVDLQDSCTRLAARVTGRSDPTAGARLVVKTSPERLREDSTAATVGVLCYLVTPDRPLTATLVGLGEQPIPYAN